jgi:tetratricopeptide (TPR) repeat protein
MLTPTRLATPVASQGRLAGQRQRCLHALFQAEQQGRSREIGPLRLRLARLALETNDHRTAWSEAARAYRLAVSTPDRRLLAEAEWMLGLAALTAGHPSTAARHLSASLHRHLRHGDYRQGALIRLDLGRAYTASGQLAHADATLRTALTVLKARGATAQAGAACRFLAINCQRSGDQEQAQRWRQLADSFASAHH